MPDSINILVPKSSINSIIETDRAITNLDEHYMRLVKTIEQGNQTLNQNKVSFDNINKAQTTAKNTNKELDKGQKQLIATEERLKILRTDVGRQMIKNREESRLLTAQIKGESRASNILKGSYEQINQALTGNIQKYKQLSAEQRKNSKEGKALLSTIQKQDRSLKKLDAQLGKSNRHVGNYGRAITTSAKSLLGAFGLVAGVALFAKVLRDSGKAIVDFQKRQSSLQAISGKTAKELTVLTKQAKQLGSQTEFTATQVTELQIELAKLGFTTDSIRLSTKAILAFASATGADLAAAAKVAGSALNAFGISSARTEEVVASLAVSTTKSALSFDDFETVISTVGTVARSFGFTLQDTLGFVGKLRDNALDASKASTAFRNILLNLADANGALAKRLGRTVTNSDELIAALIELREDGVSLNETLELTDKRSVAAFNAFLDGAEKAGELRDSVTGVNDELQVMVDKKLDNLAGDVTKLSSAWEGFVLKAEGGVNALRGVIKFFNNFLIQISNLDIVFRRAAKMTDEQVSRAFDGLMAKAGKKANAFREVIKKYEKSTIQYLNNNKQAFIDEVQEAGQSRNEAIKLFDVFMVRRQEQVALELQVEADKVKQQEELDRKAGLAKRDADKKVTEAEKKESIKRAEQRKKEMEEKLKAEAQAETERRKILVEEAKVYQEMLDEDRLATEKAAKEKADIEKAQQELAVTRRFELANIQANIARATIKDEEELRQRLFEIDNELLTEQLNSIDLLIQGTTEGTVERANLEQQLAELRMEQDNMVSDNSKANDEERLARMQEIAMKTIDVTDQVGSALFEIYANRLEAESQELDKQLEKQLEIAGDDEKQREIIEERFKKKQDEIRFEQAKNDRNAALFAIAINTAQAITKAMTLGFPAAIPAIILATALGAVQAGVVLSKPLPTFAEGTKGEFSTPRAFIAGEAGEEWLESPRGDVTVVDKATAFTNAQGYRVYSNPEIEKLQRAGKVGYDTVELKRLNETMNRGFNKTTNAIKNQRQYLLDNRGKVIGTKQNNHTQRYIERMI